MFGKKRYLFKHVFHFLKKIRLLAGIKCKYLQVVHIPATAFAVPCTVKCEADWDKAPTGLNMWTMQSSAGSTLILAIFVNILGG